MCGGSIAVGAAFCRTCGADLTRAGVVLSSVVTPISPRTPRTRVRILSKGGLIVLAAAVGLTLVTPVSARIPVFSTVNSIATHAVRRILAWRRTPRPQQPTIGQQAPPGTVPPAGATNRSTVPAGTPAVAATASPAETPTTAAADASVTILSEPVGAKVQVDAILVGTTPLTLKSVSVGTHTVRVYRQGYVPISNTFKVDRSASVTLRLTLTPAGRATRKQTRTAALPPELSRKPLEIGTRAPHFSLKDRIGVIYRLRDMLGQRVPVLMLWHLDSQARTAIRDLDVLSRKAEGRYRPLVIVFVPDRMAIRSFVTSAGITVPILFGNDRIAETYGVSKGVPVLYMISEQGIITRRQTGAIQLAAILP